MKEQRTFIRSAERKGWTVSYTKAGHIKLSRPGVRPVYAAGTPSDRRAWKNALCEMRRAVRQ